MWITNDRNNRKFNSVVKPWKFYLDDARGRSFNDAMNVIDKNYLSEYIRFLLHRAFKMTRSYIWIDITRVENNMHEMKDMSYMRVSRFY